jgi:hypothetical protein
MVRILTISLAALSLCVWISGCGNGADQPAARPSASTGHEGHDHGAEAEHAHPTEGPHGGHLIELGDEQFHAELLHDEATHTVTVHILDASGKKPVAIEQDALSLQIFQDGKFVNYVLKPAGEPGAGGASQFAITSEPLTDLLLHEENVQGRLRATIDGNEYTGIVEHAAHDHAGHDHDHAGHDH